MYAIIGMGEESQNIEAPCMLFETKQDAEGHLSKIPWLYRCENSGVIYDDGMEDPIMYVIPEGLYDKAVPPALLATLPQEIINRAKDNLTYGKAVGLHFFTCYNDRPKRVTYYVLLQVQPGKAFVGFAGESESGDGSLTQTKLLCFCGLTREYLRSKVRRTGILKNNRVGREGKKLKAFKE
ncbi:MAG: hypothetical protein PVH64_07550 [Bacillota bacterium]|jgi:hypothetical protein